MDGRVVIEIAHLLGHPSPAVTLKVYAHWFKNVKTDALSNLARVVCGDRTQRLRHPLALRKIATWQDQLGTTPHQPLRDLKADTPGRTGYDRSQPSRRGVSGQRGVRFF